MENSITQEFLVMLVGTVRLVAVIDLASLPDELGGFFGHADGEGFFGFVDMGLGKF